jgi:hypothetical protein
MLSEEVFRFNPYVNNCSCALRFSDSGKIAHQPQENTPLNGYVSVL